MSASRETAVASRLLRLDAIGATVTVAMLLGVFATGWVATGLSLASLLALGGAATLIAAFSWHAALRGGPSAPKLRRLAWVNALYAGATILACMVQRDSISVPGGCYFSIEVGVLLSLAGIELRLARDPGAVPVRSP